MFSELVEQTDSFLARIQSVPFETDDDLRIANTILGEVKEQWSALDKAEKEITAPQRAAIAAARDLFADQKASLKAAEATLKMGIARALREREERLADSLACEVPDVSAMVPVIKLDGVSVRRVAKVVFTDPSLVPREYCEPDHAKVLAALEDGVTVPGARLDYEEVITRRRGAR